MPEKDLNALLQELRQAVAASDEITPAQRAQLKDLEAQIHLRLDESRPGPDEDPVQAVRGFIDEFQRSHPTLTLTLGRILDALNKMGI